MSHPYYTEACGRFLHYPAPAGYDDWGWNDKDERWEHTWAMMDDFGNAVPVDWPYQIEDCSNYFGPDYNAQVEPGEIYPYIMHQAPICH